MPTLSTKTIPYYGGGQVDNPANVIQTRGAPSANLTEQGLGTLAVDNAASTVYCLTSKVGGVVSWSQLAAGSITYPASPYVVGPTGKAGYQTIQLAINAANTAGGGTVFIQPGTYTENLTIYNKVNLLAYPGELGAIGVTTSSAMVPSVTIVGNTLINTSALIVDSNNTFSNILFSPSIGDAISFISNENFESVISFDGCTINVTETTKSAFSCDGFPTINLLNCSITETNIGTCNLLSVPGSFPFTIIKAKNTSFFINSTVPCVLQSSSDVHFYMSDCMYSSMIDISASAGSYFNINASNTVFTWSGASNNPLVSIGNQEGSINVDGSSFLTGSGAFLTATTPSSNTFSVITNSNFVNTIKLYGTAIDQYSGCTFTTGSSASILMNGTSGVSFSSCTINSTTNPAISGAGSGILTLGDITFLSNSSISGTLNITWATTKTGNSTITGDLTLGSVGNKIIIPTGSNASVGTSGVMSGTPGVVTVATTACSASAKIFYSRAVTGGTPGQVSISSQDGTGFTLTSTGNETSTFNWWIINA